MRLWKPGLRSFAVVLLLTGCASPAASPTSAPKPTSVAPTTAPAAASSAASPSSAALATGPLQLGSLTFNNHGLQDAKGRGDLELEADDFYFQPTFIQGNPGQKLRLEIENEGKVQHNFSIEAQRIDQNIAPDGKIEVDVTFPQSGVLRFYCKFHVAQGMNGELLAGTAQPQPVSTAPSTDTGY